MRVESYTPNGRSPPEADSNASVRFTTSAQRFAARRERRNGSRVGHRGTPPASHSAAMQRCRRGSRTRPFMTCCYAAWQREVRAFRALRTCSRFSQMVAAWGTMSIAYTAGPRDRRGAVTCAEVRIIEVGVVVEEPPQQDVRVEQQDHDSKASSSSGMGASKSSAIRPCPRQRPGVRGLVRAR